MLEAAAGYGAGRTYIGALKIIENRNRDEGFPSSRHAKQFSGIVAHSLGLCFDDTQVVLESGKKAIEEMVERLQKSKDWQESVQQIRFSVLAPTLKNYLSFDRNALLAQVQLEQAGTEPDPLHEKQIKILKLLDGRAMTGADLARAMKCTLAQLHRCHIRPLKAMNRVINDRKIRGYYRPDSPPK